MNEKEQSVIKISANKPHFIYLEEIIDRIEAQIEQIHKDNEQIHKDIEKLEQQLKEMGG